MSKSDQKSLSKIVNFYYDLTCVIKQHAYCYWKLFSSIILPKHTTLEKNSVIASCTLTA